MGRCAPAMVIRGTIQLKPAINSGRAVPVARRVHRFSYAIRNIVSEARAVEARGMRVRYLNIGDPVAFGFKTPPHLVEAATAAMRDGHNGYLASRSGERRVGKGGGWRRARHRGRRGRWR